MCHIPDLYQQASQNTTVNLSRLFKGMYQPGGGIGGLIPGFPTPIPAK